MHDPILLWNAIALEANRVSHTNGRGEQAGPPLSARALAIVHLAIYETFALTDKTADLPPYLDPSTLPIPGAKVDRDSAIAGAAHHALAELFPSQKATFDLALSAVCPDDLSRKYGIQVAKLILKDRADDPGSVGLYMPSDLPGKHRVDPDNTGQGFHAPEYGHRAKGFAISARHEILPPPFANNVYNDALEEVREKGIRPDLAGTLPADADFRTPTQTLIGIFWGYDGALQLGTPPRLYNQILREFARDRGQSVVENLILFTLANVAMADAGILAWREKYRYNFWRPVLGVREHGAGLGPCAEPKGAAALAENSDPFWLPLGAPNSNRVGAKNFTPNFPAYPSGHATFGAASLHIPRLIQGKGGRFSKKNLGSDKLFKGSFVSEEFNGTTVDNQGTARPRHARTFPGGFWDMIVENGASRVFLGVHWIFDANAGTLRKPDFKKNVGGIPLGLRIAEDIFDRFEQARKKKSPWHSPVMEETSPFPQPVGCSESGASSYTPWVSAR